MVCIFVANYSKLGNINRLAARHAVWQATKQNEKKQQLQKQKQQKIYPITNRLVSFKLN